MPGTSSRRRSSQTRMPRSGNTALTLRQAVLERPLDRGVDGVEAIEGQSLRRPEALAGQRVGPVVGQEAVRDGVELLVGKGLEPVRPLRDELLTEDEVTHQSTGLAERDLGAKVELARLAQIVQDRSADKQVGVQARVEGAGLEPERGHRDRVLQEAAEVGVMAGAGARGAAELGAEARVAQERVEERAQVRVVDLARQTLQKAVELVEIETRDGQELGGVGAGGSGAADRAMLHLELVPEALDPTGHPVQIAALELTGQEVGVAERARVERARAVAQLDGEVGGAALGGET